jgi:enterochelin esterase-like enzyme
MIFSNVLVACTFMGVLLSNSLMSQDHFQIKDCIIPATSEHDTIRFGILLPQSYSTSDKVYPVIYHLHGLNSHYTNWQAQKVADFFSTNSEVGFLPECILVFPDGGEGFWCNHYDGDPLIENEIIQFLIPHIDHNYPTDKNKRMIMGWSAGGAGAVYLFSKHPKLFKTAISFDGTIVTWDDFMYFQGKRPEIVNNSDYYYEFCSPDKWVSRNRNTILEKQDTALFLTAAFLAPYHKNFFSILENEGIPFYYRKLTCDHEFGCVFDGINEDLLLFLSRSLK